MLVSRNAETCTPTSIRRQPMSNNKGPLPASTTSPSGINPELLYSTSTAVQGITPGIVQPGRGMGRSIAPTAIRETFRLAMRIDGITFRGRSGNMVYLQIIVDLPYGSISEVISPTLFEPPDQGTSEFILLT